MGVSACVGETYPKESDPSEGTVKESDAYRSVDTTIRSTCIHGAPSHPEAFQGGKLAKGGYTSVAKVGTGKQNDRYPDNHGPSKIYPLTFRTTSRDPTATFGHPECRDNSLLLALDEL